MKHILICDDEPHILEGLRYLLKDPGRTIEVAHNGKQALQRIAAQPPDLLITDVMMPEMNGLELITGLRADATTKDLPIIILTAKGQAQHAVMAQEAWGATVIAKPFEPRKVKELVATTLEIGSCPPLNCT